MQASGTNHGRAALFLVDTGNTRVKFGLFYDNSREFVARQLPICESFTAGRLSEPAMWDTVRKSVTIPRTVERAVITGSNPQQIERLVAEWPSDWPPPELFNRRTFLPIEIDVDYPERVGIDRLLNAIAANVLRAEGQPAIIIDVGTATTVNAVSKFGAFLGGVILPGPEMSARALHEHTAMLPCVSLADLSDEEPPVIGRNTEAAIQSGLYWGHWDAVLGCCERFQSLLGSSPQPLVLLTGGAAQLYAGRLPAGAQFLPHLTLQGLAVTVRAYSNVEDQL